MSNYICRIKIKSTGEIVEARAIDSYKNMGGFTYYVPDKNGKEDSGIYYRDDEVEELEPIASPEESVTSDLASDVASGVVSGKELSGIPEDSKVITNPGKTWQKCPVCEGRGNVRPGFYSEIKLRSGSDLWTREECRTCKGIGII